MIIADKNKSKYTVPIISVIVPAYNMESYIAQCLTSIIEQTEHNIEVLVVDDGSTDRTQEIVLTFIRKYGTKIIYLYQKNAGVSAARNYGLDVARGEYISFIDADDSIVKYFYEYMLLNMKKTGSDLVECGRVDIYNIEGKKISKNINTCTEDYIDLTKKIEVNKGSLFVWDKLFKNEIISKIFLRFPTNIKYTEDAVFLIEYKLNCQKISYCHKNLYYYTATRECSATGSNINMFDIIDGMKAIIDIAFKYNKFKEIIGDIGNIAAGCYSRRILSFVRNPNIQMDNFIKSFIKFFDTYIPNWKKRVCWYRSRKNRYTYIMNHYRLYLTTIKIFLVISRIKIFFSNLCNRILRLLIIAYKANMKIYKELKLDLLPNVYQVFCKKPIKCNSALLVSYFGANISDSMFYMIKDLLSRGIEVFVGTNYVQRDQFFCQKNELNVKLVKINSRMYLEALATCHYLALNSRFPTYFNKRDEQILLNTWHGTPLKTLGRKVNRGLSDLGNNQSQFLMSNYLMFPNEYTYSHMMRDFSLDKLFMGKAVLCGYPRNSVLFNRNSAKVIREELQIQNKKVFIYMPTWRGETLSTRNIELYGQEIFALLKELDKHLHDDIVLYVKLHQLVMNKINILQYKHIKCFDARYENYQFMAIADCLITDYSSVMYDFLNLERPIVLFIYDYEWYNRSRGVYLNIKSLNFNKVYNVDELVGYMNSFKKHNCSYDKEKKMFCQFDSYNTPSLINDVMILDKASENIRIIDFHKKDHLWNLYLMPQLTREDKIMKFFEIKNNDKNAVFVFAQETFTKKTEQILKKYNEEIIYMITPIKSIHASWQKIIIKLVNCNMLKCPSHLFISDMNRISRGLRLGKINNFSNYRWFKFLAKCWESPFIRKSYYQNIGYKY